MKSIRETAGEVTDFCILVIQCFWKELLIFVSSPRGFLFVCTERCIIMGWGWKTEEEFESRGIQWGLPVKGGHTTENEILTVWFGHCNGPLS